MLTLAVFLRAFAKKKKKNGGAIRRNMLFMDRSEIRFRFT